MKNLQSYEKPHPLEQPALNPLTPSFKRVIGGVFISLGLFFGIYFSYLTGGPFDHLQAKVIRSQIIEKQGSFFNLFDYGFSLGGREYIGVSYVPLSLNANFRLKIGDSVPVYYSILNPNFNAFGVAPNPTPLVLLSLSFVILGVVILYFKPSPN